MKRTLTAALTALAFAAASLAPAPALARGYHGGSSHHYRHYGHNGDAAVAAGVLGLVLGLAIGSAASESNRSRGRYDERYGRSDRYEQDRYYEDERRAEYDRDYGRGDDRGDTCVRPMRHWDPYSASYVWVNVATPC